jgi:iron(III) transport system substrate-binding protein
MVRRDNPHGACAARRSVLAGIGAWTFGRLSPRPLVPQAAGATTDELVVYSTTDQAEVDDVLAAFAAATPDVPVRYSKQNSAELYARIVKDTASRGDVADLVWSSAMDLQMKLVNDGYAQTATLPDLSHLPRWAVWQEQAYGITAEPIVLAYNRSAIAPEEVPKDRPSLLAFLTRNAASLQGKIATYDPEVSGSGLLFLAQDVAITPTTWELVTAIGRTNPKLLATTDAMLEGISSGRLLLAYNAIGSYAMARAEHDPAVGVVVPADYVTVVSRIAFIPAAARHPERGKQFLDLLLSRNGQTLLARHYLGAVRDDLPNVAFLERIGNGSRVQPIHIGPELLVFMDHARRAAFLRQWHHAIQQR